VATIIVIIYKLHTSLSIFSLFGVVALAASFFTALAAGGTTVFGLAGASVEED